MRIDVAFDVRTDAGGGDPDRYSPTLLRYHQRLWSKPLPSGAPFDLSADTSRGCLHHSSSLGAFRLTSDGMIPTFIRRRAMKHIIDLLPDEENERFLAIGYTIGDMIVFPGNRIGRQQTINMARGVNRKISDRFDLTLECIRRHYVNEGSPLAYTLSLYADFFALFGDFRGYVSFFLLDDFVTDERGVRFCLPFDDFRSSPLPADVDAYKEYRRRSIDLIDARNHRIEQLYGCSRLA